MFKKQLLLVIVLFLTGCTAKPTLTPTPPVGQVDVEEQAVTISYSIRCTTIGASSL